MIGRGVQGVCSRNEGSSRLNIVVNTNVRCADTAMYFFPRWIDLRH